MAKTVAKNSNVVQNDTVSGGKMSQEPLKLVIYREEGGWVARCLQHDIAAYGKTSDEAKKELRYLIFGYVIACVEHSERPFQHAVPAPGEFWEMFGEASEYQLEYINLGAAMGVPRRAAQKAMVKVYDAA